MKLRKWLEIIIFIVSLIAFIIMCSECDDTFIFITSKIIALAVMIFNMCLIEKYGTIFNK